MFEDIEWPGAAVIAVVLIIWAFNVHADRENRQQLRRDLVAACTHDPEPDTSVERCAVELRQAVEGKD